MPHFNLGGQERTVRTYTELSLSLSHVHIFTGLPALLSQKGSNKAGRLPAVSLSCKGLCWLLAAISDYKVKETYLTQNNTSKNSKN